MPPPLLKLLWLAILMAAGAATPPLDLVLRSRVELFRGLDQWAEAQVRAQWNPAETAIVICDMWDKHWCRGATGRVNQLVPKMNPVLEAARARGITIVHAPSDTMKFYANHPARLAILKFPPVAPPADLPIPKEPKLPIDDSDGGCDTPGDKSYTAWTSQHPGLRIDERDFVSDKGAEIYSMFRARGIRRVFLMGVHTNMCVLNRSFAIRQMTRWGIPCILVRDLTDAMYDPADAPHVSHEQGTELVIQHIEKYWAPTILSADLMRALEQPKK